METTEERRGQGLKHRLPRISQGIRYGLGVFCLPPSWDEARIAGFRGLGFKPYPRVQRLRGLYHTVAVFQAIPEVLCMVCVAPFLLRACMQEHLKPLDP